MTNEEYELLVTKALENAPEWLFADIENIIKDSKDNNRISFVISELYKRYTFNFTHLFAAMDQNSEWSVISRERLNFIDNNIDLIQAMMKKYQ
ncbi:hypothetical protein [Metabacillus sediminilitoris]|uniref:Uncharacterized protein n=1 Tax=Metabacillus sediminilitoris TaxID=2567941 RepID=A0A4S4C4D9_9BACI|nr:hypothetical protein [Metabacillus sediminilitoris]QGQ45283.1 hypothetical protein GMB29_08455 [Metabacillus sediminilitoris]THF82418.1 hypothetical protein E6W99_03025 [Metabacillus sediminilitoris]